MVDRGRSRGLARSSAELRTAVPRKRLALNRDDILLTLADKPIASSSQVNFLLRRMKPGTEIAFGLVRDGVQMEKTVQLGTQPEFR